jgi:hypothetical protein
MEHVQCRCSLTTPIITSMIIKKILKNDSMSVLYIIIKSYLTLGNLMLKNGYYFLLVCNLSIPYQIFCMMTES